MRPRLLPDVLALAQVLLPVLDLVLVVISAMLAAIFMDWFKGYELWPWSDSYRNAVIFTLVILPLVFYRFGLYDSRRGEGLAHEWIQIIGACFAAFALVALFAVLTKSNTSYSRGWFLSWLLFCICILIFIRTILRLLLHRLRSRGFDSRKVFLVGNGELAERVIRQITESPMTGYRIKAYFAKRPINNKSQYMGVRYLGDLDDMQKYLSRSRSRPDQIWLALQEEESTLLKKTLPRLLETLIDIRLVPDMLEFTLLNQSTSQVIGIPLIDMSRSPMSGINRIIKGIEDRMLGIGLFILLLPLMILISVAIKVTTPGPVLFTQRRHGWNGEEIIIYKFRTMTLHDESDGQVTQAQQSDQRVTRFGRFLRRFSLDELPQFINVLEGNMSVVGPRPHAIEHNSQYMSLVSGYMLRHKVKPGITGWAQINGFRGETSTIDKMKKRIEYDLYYIEHWSVWFDLVIVALTVVHGIFTKKAY